MSGHVAPRRVYYLVFLALIVGTGLTVCGGASSTSGSLNNVVMLAIALRQGARSSSSSSCTCAGARG